jgi:hypothetical protein
MASFGSRNVIMHFVIITYCIIIGKDEKRDGQENHHKGKRHRLPYLDVKELYEKQYKGIPAPAKPLY